MITTRNPFFRTVLVTLEGTLLFCEEESWTLQIRSRPAKTRLLRKRDT